MAGVRAKGDDVRLKSYNEALVDKVSWNARVTVLVAMPRIPLCALPGRIHLEKVYVFFAQIISLKDYSCGRKARMAITRIDAVLGH